MAAKLEKLDGNRAKLEINVSPKDFEAGIDKVYQKQKGKFNIPGFRKGKAPRVIIENHYGPQIFFEDAFEEIFPEVYRAAIDEHALEVVSRPENVEIQTINLKEGILFSAEVVLKPEVKLGKYDGIKVKKLVKTTSAKDVEAEIERIRNQNARWVEVDRTVKEGDTVVIDYLGTLDDVPFDGGKAENQSLEIGSKRFIPGFEEQIIGMKKDEEKKLFVKFPDEYSADLAGKDAVFDVKVHEVKEKKLPDVDDEFVQDVSEFDTLAEYKKDVKKKLQKQLDDQSKVDMENQVLSALAEDAEVDIPTVMIDGQIDYQMQDLSYRLMYQGIRLEEYLQHMGKSMDEFREGYRETAAQQVKMQLAVEALIKELKLEPTPEETEKRMEELAKEAGKTLQEYKNMMGNEELDRFADRVAMERVFDYLVEHADITDVPADAAGEEKPAAKKAATKKPAAKKKEDGKQPAEKKPAAKKPAAKKSATKKTEEKPAAKK
ncbi:trigger factor [Christensenellaceae bacterium OttesenSCG-928-K19]|nr:trigger factor [Christensenellaceae bacterium OttesenSCG-928-K19]